MHIHIAEWYRWNAERCTRNGDPAGAARWRRLLARALALGDRLAHE